MIKYEGIFFNKDMVNLIHSLELNRLPVEKDEIHITFKHLPNDSEIFNEIAGKSFDLYLIGYACDGRNSGFLVELPEELIPYYINYKEEKPSILIVPHITASLIEGAEAKDTMNLEFKPLKNKIKITGTFGFYINDNDKEYTSFEKQIKNQIN